MPRDRRLMRGFALVYVYSAAMVLVLIAVAASARAFTEWRVAQAQRWGAQALYVAEAGVDQAMAALRADYSWSEGFTQESSGAAGTYDVTVEAQGNQRTLTAVGTVATPGGGTVQRTVTVVVRQGLPANFFDKAIYSASAVTFNGSAYQVTGSVLSGDVTTTLENTDHVSGQITYDAAAHPLPALDYQQLHDLASAQGNLYDAARLAQVQQGTDQFPAGFWRTPPTDPNDPTTGVPNIVYVTTDLQLNGDIGTIGGLFVVVGNVLTDPAASEDTTLNGRGTVDGPIYTRGQFRINGGGGQLNVLGGVWAGTEARLNGTSQVTYQVSYMAALEGLLQSDVQMVLWREGG